ncbi:MAG: ergothioneine biosynthesis protein EgtB [Acidimicrobiia bacterium]
MKTAVAHLRRSLASSLEHYRRRTKGMIAPLDDDDLHRQHDDIMSPLVWDVGHVGNFEEYWLLREIDGRSPHDPRYDEMYNPFDNPRWVRGDLPLLKRGEALSYIDEVRGDALAILERVELDPDRPLLRDGYVFEMVIQHEAQHQETMLQALDLRRDLRDYPGVNPARVLNHRSVDDTERVVIPGGSFLMGTNDTAAAYDNERPQHRVEVAGFAIDRFPVSNRRYARFIEAGGYRNPEYWTDAGWQWRTGADLEAPQGWIRQVGGDWLVSRFGYVVELDPAEPVQHVCFHEAEAFARFEGGRLPTEAEWEKAASWGPEATSPRTYPWGSARPQPELANLGQQRWGPAPVGSYPAGASAYGVEQLLGDVYEWTSSPFVGYPGFSAFPYPEYSEVFFDDPGFRVLRGASWATSTDVARNTFRNWDYRTRRQIFAGIRLAWDV